MSTVDPPREFLTVSEVAVEIRQSEKSIRRKIARGEITAVQLGGRGSAIRIPSSALTTWLYGPQRAA